MHTQSNVNTFAVFHTFPDAEFSSPAFPPLHYGVAFSSPAFFCPAFSASPFVRAVKNKRDTFLRQCAIKK